MRRKPQRHKEKKEFKKIFVLFLSLWFFLIVPVQAEDKKPETAASGVPAQLKDVGLDQKLNEQVPLDLVFKDDAGKTVQLKDYFGKKPVILTLVQYECPMLCNLILNGLVQSLNAVPFDVGNQFDVIVVSFDTRETPELAAAKKKNYLKRYLKKDSENGWHFLTADENSIKEFTKSVGFRYTYDPVKNQFAHASGIIVLTPEGKLSRYFYGVEYSPRDVKLGLVEASQNKIGSPVDQILLFCYHYDPATGKYSPMVYNLVRLGGILTVLALGSFMVTMWRLDLKKSRKQEIESS